MPVLPLLKITLCRLSTSLVLKLLPSRSLMSPVTVLNLQLSSVITSLVSQVLRMLRTSSKASRLLVSTVWKPIRTSMSSLTRTARFLKFVSQLRAITSTTLTAGLKPVRSLRPQLSLLNPVSMLSASAVMNRLSVSTSTSSATFRVLKMLLNPSVTSP